MDALVDQFAAAGEGRGGVLLAVVTLAAAVTVARPQEHQRPEGAAVDQFARLLQGGMVAVIVTNPDANALGAGGRLDRAELGGVERTGLLDQHMFAGEHGSVSDRGEGGVERRDNHRGDPRVGEDRLIIRHGDTPRRQLREVGGSLGVEVARVEHRRVPAESAEAFATDKATADEGEKRLLGTGAVHSVRINMEGEAKRRGDASEVLR